MFNFNSLLILSDKKNNQHMITLKEGARFSTKYGHIEHNDIALLDEGDIIKSNLGHLYLVYKPTYMDFVMNIKRQAQIIYPKDVAAMLMWCDISYNQNILEAGAGQGALSLGILRVLANTGSLTTYEIREDFAKQSEKFISQFLGYAPENHKIEIRDIYLGIDGEYDRVLLDLPEPWQVVPHLKTSLKNGGLIVTYLPTILQVKNYVEALKESGYFSNIETAELTRRPWKVDGQAIRPEMWIYNHSAFIISARKMKV